MRLIDADLMAAEETEAFISAQAQITDTATKLVNEVVHKKIQMLLADAPTVDVDRPTRSKFKRMAVQLGYEPVVHCKDCRRGEPDLYLYGGEDEVWCNYYDYPKPAAGFCEKGKMRTYE